MKSLLLVVALSWCISGSVCQSIDEIIAAAPPAEEDPLSPGKHPLVLNDNTSPFVKPEAKERAKSLVNKFLAAHSGLPLTCLDSQFLFSSNSVFEVAESPKGVGSVYKDCVHRFAKPLAQAEAFLTSDIEFLGPYTVAFQRTILLVTHERCRITWKGITTLDLETENGELRIKRGRDFYDADALRERLQACMFPEFAPGEIKNPEPPKDEHNAEQEL